MVRRAGGIRLAALMAAVIVLLLVSACAAWAEDDPIRVSSRCEPQSVVSEQDVTVTIKIYNSGQTDVTQDITLHDPLGISVEKYLGGLKAEQSVTYTGTWHVTQDQINAGRIDYFIQYYVDTADGPQRKVNTIPVTLQAASAEPQLTATYTISPAAAAQGQQVTLSYTLSNTGNVGLSDITVTNDGVSDQTLTTETLAVGEKVTLTDTFTMGNEEVVSYPTVTYSADGSSETMTIDDMARRTITVAEDGLDATLEIEPTENIYPGEAVDVKLTIKNSGETAYTGLTATMPDGTVIAEDVELAPGASHEASVAWTPQGAGAVSASITGLGAEGEAIGVASNDVELSLQDEMTALVLRIRAQAQETTIYSEPAVVRFGIVVENIGQTDATTLTITEAGTTVATIPSLPAGESRTVVVDLQTSIAGQIQFEVSGKDALGNTRSYASNIITLVYVAPTPEPTAAPTPTPVPPTPSPAPTATPAPTLGEIISEHVDMRVLIGAAIVLAAVAGLGVTLTIISSVKRRKRMAGALDTIELTPDVRNHRGTKRAAKKRDARKKDGMKEEEQAPDAQQIVPTPELTAEETLGAAEAEKKPAAPAAAPKEREESRRRRPMADVEVPTDSTLRVAPVGERPDFVAQGKVDDSRTRVFTRMTPKDDGQSGEPFPAQATPDAATLDTGKGAPGSEKDELQADRTIRFDRRQIDQAMAETARHDVYDKGGKKREDIKPMKKKRFPFGKKGEDDMSDDDLLDFFDDDKDLFE